MNSIKCKHCGFSNFGSEAECRRCRGLLSGKQTLKNKDGKRPPMSALTSVLLYVALAGSVYLLYTSLQRSMADVDNNEAFRVGTQAPQKTTQPGLSRNEADRQHANGVGAAIKENPNLAAQRQHDADTRKLMQEASR